MKKITLAKLERKYKNNGQEAERIFRYTLTGIDMKADNREGADLDNIQIKSSRATVCKGTDLKTFIENDVAEIYAYVTENFENAFLMNKTEWTEFCKMFGTVTTESAKNGGKVKIRLKTENEKMKAYLARQAFTRSRVRRRRDASGSAAAGSGSGSGLGRGRLLGLQHFTMMKWLALHKILHEPIFHFNHKF